MRLRLLTTWLRICTLAAVLSAVRLVPLWLVHGSYVAGAGPPAPSLEVLTIALLRPWQSAEVHVFQDWPSWEASCYIGLAGLALLLGGIWLAMKEVTVDGSVTTD